MSTIRTILRGATAWAAPLCVLALATAACGSDSQAQPQVNSARRAPSVVLSATLSVSGSVTLSGSWTDGISSAATAANCAEAANGYIQDGSRYDPPRTPVTTPFETHLVVLSAHLVGYHGPGTYPVAAVAGDQGSPILLTIDGNAFAAIGDSNVTVVVNPDDSGTMKFDKLHLPPPPAPTPPPPGRTPAPTAPPPAVVPSISGQLAWTCTNRFTPAPSVAPTPAVPVKPGAKPPVTPASTLPH